jgi:hypothetical protein
VGSVVVDSRDAQQEENGVLNGLGDLEIHSDVLEGLSRQLASLTLARTRR